MKLVVESAGAVASRVRIGRHELTFDQPDSVPLGRDIGPSPLDVLAASVGACAHYFVAAYLGARQLPTDELRVYVEAEKVRDPTPRFGRLSLHVEVPPGLRSDQLAAVERVVKNCPAYGTLLHGPDVELTIEVSPGAAA
jgi:putative redox protein